MDPLDTAKLALMGWTVECESPFEVRHEDGSFATGQAAYLVLEACDEFRNVTRLSSYQQLKRLEQELVGINELVQSWVARSSKGLPDMSKDDDSLWKASYEMIFSEPINGRVAKISRDMSLFFDWDDPDASYEDDVCAYARSLDDFVKKASFLLASSSE